MARTWDEHGNPVDTAPQSWDENGNPVTGVPRDTRGTDKIAAPPAGAAPVIPQLQGKPSSTESDFGNAALGALRGVGGSIASIPGAILDIPGTINSMGKRMSDLRTQGRDESAKGDYADALQHGMAGMIPMVGPWMSDALDTITSPNFDAGKSGEAVGSMIAPALLPRVMRGAGAGLQKAAEPMMETALGTKAIDRAFAGKRVPVGRAFLDNVPGLTPESLADNAEDVIQRKNGEIDQNYKGVQGKGSITPARGVIDDRILQAQEGNSTYVPPVGRGRVPELGQMRRQLTEPGPNFAGDTEYPQGAISPIQITPGTRNQFTGSRTPATVAGGAPTADPVISPDQSAVNLRKMKQEFGKDFTRWNSLNPSGEMPTARGAYGAMDNQLDQLSPENARLNDEVSSLIHGKQGAEMRDLRGGIVNKVINRTTARTGALAAALAGGITHGLPGAAAGLILPELAGDPVVQAIAAKGMNAGGKLIQYPFVTQAARVSPFIKKQENQ